MNDVNYDKPRTQSAENCVSMVATLLSFGKSNANFMYYDEAIHKPAEAYLHSYAQEAREAREDVLRQFVAERDASIIQYLNDKSPEESNIVINPNLVATFTDKNTLVLGAKQSSDDYIDTLLKSIAYYPPTNPGLPRKPDLAFSIVVAMKIACAVELLKKNSNSIPSDIQPKNAYHTPTIYFDSDRGYLYYSTNAKNQEENNE